MLGRAATRPRRILALGLAALAVGCSPSSDEDPATLFAKAEEYRRAFEEEASHKAIDAYRDARAAWVREDDYVRAATASRKLGETYEELGLIEDALREYREAESLCQRSCGPRLESAIRSDLGLTLAMLDESDSARDQCDQALSLAREAGVAREEARALSCAGEVAYFDEKLDEAIDFHRQAQAAWELAGDPRGTAESLNYQGAVLVRQNRLDEARAAIEQALSRWRSSGYVRGQGMALGALAHLEHRGGAYQNALNLYREALRLLEPIGDQVWQAQALGGIGKAYFDMGNGTQALSYLNSALALYREARIPMAIWDTLLQVGSVQLYREESSAALESFHEALNLAEKDETGHWTRAFSLQHVALALQAQGKVVESLERLEQALELNERVDDAKWLEALIRLAMGKGYELLNDLTRAAESFEQALKLSRELGDRIAEVEGLYGLARIARARNDLGGALDAVEHALDVAEALRDAVLSRDLRTSYVASVFGLHELYIDVLMALHEARPREGFAARAFAASERARARSLLESLTEAGVDIRDDVDDPELLQREEELKRRLNERIERRVLSKLSSDEARKLDEEIQELQTEHDEAVARIRSRSPSYAALTRREPLGLEDVQDRLLDEDTMLLEYALGERQSFLWAVSKNEYSSFELPPRTDIEDAAERLKDLLTARTQVLVEDHRQHRRRLDEADRLYPDAASRLSQILLGSVAEKLAGKRLLVVADGALQDLPFGVLPSPRSGNENVPMLVEYEIVNLPSASSLAVLRSETEGREPPKRSVLVIADPVFEADDPRLDPKLKEVNPVAHQTFHDSGFLRNEGLGIQRLAATRQEAEAILKTAPAGTSMVAVDFDAARHKAMSAELHQYQILHFATHGIVNGENPAMSGILLSMFDESGEPQDGFLRLHDIYELDLSADLVVLSACDTGLGKRIRGEGIVGIVGAFMYAGAQRVISSLWKVDDDATRELMSRFYREMFVSHLSPPAALRSAQLSMWREEKWRSPFFWGGFVLQGEWQDD